MYLSSRYIDEKQIFGRYKNILLEQSISETEMDPQTFQAFEDKLTKAKFTLYKEKPFFGLLLTKLRTVPTYSIPTMAVDNNANIYINPKFVIDELSPAEVTGVLAHEVMHIATETFFRQRGRRMDLWNIATDYMMNRDILEMNMSLPKMGLLPVQQGDRWIVKVEGLKPIDITDISAEELYNILLPKQEQQEKQMQKIIDKLIKEQEKLDKHLSPTI
jgi:predicted metal-dependent peptidase